MQSRTRQSFCYSMAIMSSKILILTCKTRKSSLTGSSLTTSSVRRRSSSKFNSRCEKNLTLIVRSLLLLMTIKRNTMSRRILLGASTTISSNQRSSFWPYSQRTYTTTRSLETSQTMMRKALTCEMRKHKECFIKYRATPWCRMSIT